MRKSGAASRMKRAAVPRRTTPGQHDRRCVRARRLIPGHCAPRRNGWLPTGGEGGRPSRRGEGFSGLDNRAILATMRHTPIVVLDHITVNVRDLKAARAFYQEALGAIGMKINLDFPSA